MVTLLYFKLTDVWNCRVTIHRVRTKLKYAPFKNPLRQQTVTPAQGLTTTLHKTAAVD